MAFKSPMKSARKFWDFTQPADLVLEVEGRGFYVHRHILISSSPVFQVMLESDNFIEKQSDRIALPDKNAIDIQQILNFIYPFGHKITETTDLESLLNLSREYQIQKIKDLCEAKLLREIPSVDLFIIAQEYDLSILKEKCLKQLSEKALSGLHAHPRFHEINNNYRLQIMECQLKRLQTYCKKISQIANASDARYLQKKGRL